MKNLQSANKPVLKNRKINDATICLYSHLTLSDILLDFDSSFQQVCMQPMKHLIETNTALFSLLQNSIENRIACCSYSIQVEKKEHSGALDKTQFVMQGRNSNSLQKEILQRTNSSITSMLCLSLYQPTGQQWK